jgi:hypothetical protein
MHPHDEIAMALWRRLDTPGHDAARLCPAPDGWILRGTTVYREEAGPASIHYEVLLDRSWMTLRGRVQGFMAGQEIDDVVTREGGAWSFNGRKVPGLDHLVDLDFGFTPATNLQQLRRVPIAIGAAADIPVAWVDAGGHTLVELLQRYERIGECTYQYTSPTTGYEGLLELAPNGFAAKYPPLWELIP